MSDLIRQVRASRRLPAPNVCRAIREACGVTQAEMAAQLQKHRLTVQRWEAGTRKPRGEDLIAYVDLLRKIEATR